MKKTGIIVLLLLTPLISHAYVGPGMGLTAIASLLALGSAFFISVFGFIWLPVKRFFSKNKKDDDTENIDTQDNDDTD